MANKRISVIQQSESGRNEVFRDNRTGNIMSLPEFVFRIQAGQYENYHVRHVRGRPVPASNPDGKTGNNLG